MTAARGHEAGDAEYFKAALLELDAEYRKLAARLADAEREHKEIMEMHAAVCEQSRIQALADALADLLREVEGGFIGELDYHRVKRALAAAKAVLPPPQAAP